MTILNGGFEAGDLSDWDYGEAGAPTGFSSFGVNTGSALGEGTYGLGAVTNILSGANSAAGYIEQHIDLTNCPILKLKYRISASLGTGGAFVIVGVAGYGYTELDSGVDLICDGEIHEIQYPIPEAARIANRRIYINWGAYPGETGTTQATFAFDNYTDFGPAPTAAFSFTPSPKFYPQLVGFTDISGDNPTSWLWDFGDGFTSTEQNPSHYFNGPGPYSVTLTATNGGGSDSITHIVGAYSDSEISYNVRWRLDDQEMQADIALAGLQAPPPNTDLALWAKDHRGIYQCIFFGACEGDHSFSERGGNNASTFHAFSHGQYLAENHTLPISLQSTIRYNEEDTPQRPIDWVWLVNYLWPGETTYIDTELFIRRILAMRLAFHTGVSEFHTGMTVRDNTTNAQARILACTVMTGSWEDLDAAGYLFIDTYEAGTGGASFVAGHTITDDNTTNPGSAAVAGDFHWDAESGIYPHDIQGSDAWNTNILRQKEFKEFGNGTALVDAALAIGAYIGHTWVQTWVVPGRLTFYNGGTQAFVVGGTISGPSGSGTITQVVLSSGSWAAGTAAGYVMLSDITGAILAGDTLSDGTAGATAGDSLFWDATMPGNPGSIRAIGIFAPDTSEDVVFHIPPLATFTRDANGQNPYIVGDILSEEKGGNWFNQATVRGFPTYCRDLVIETLTNPIVITLARTALLGSVTAYVKHADESADMFDDADLKIYFKEGSAPFHRGKILTGATAGAYGTIQHVTVTEGSWNGTAKGYIRLSDVQGTFKLNENLADDFPDTPGAAKIDKIPGRLGFDAGTAAFTVGKTVTDVSSGNTALILQVVLESGSWGAGTAAGYLMVSTVTGSDPFPDNSSIHDNNSTPGSATVNGTFTLPYGLQEVKTDGSTAATEATNTPKVRLTGLEVTDMVVLEYMPEDLAPIQETLAVSEVTNGSARPRPAPLYESKELTTLTEVISYLSDYFNFWRTNPHIYTINLAGFILWPRQQVQVIGWDSVPDDEILRVIELEYSKQAGQPFLTVTAKCIPDIRLSLAKRLRRTLTHDEIRTVEAIIDYYLQNLLRDQTAEQMTKAGKGAIVKADGGTYTKGPII